MADVGQHGVAQPPHHDGQNHGAESADGTGAALAWPLVKSAAALLTDVADGEDPGPTQPDKWPVPDGVPADLPSRH